MSKRLIAAALSDLNGAWDVYLVDRRKGTTRSLTRLGDSDSYAPRISADGNRVAFVTQADNLAPKQNDLHGSVGVWRKGKPFRNFTPSSTGDNDAPAISDDGTKVAFVSSIRLTGADSDNHDDVYYVDQVRRRTRLVSRGSTDYDDYGPAISGDGRFVGFNSQDDLVTGDPNDQVDAYRWSTARNHLVRLSGNTTVAPSGWPRLNGNGSVVTYVSFDLDFLPSDNNLFNDVFVRRFG